eukprot:TRINITY_DN559_c0_g1_i14.p1 TRINITY_DN559_c0_g1~~TRINITY_DN559_c0_g1_i14.p1  ORF type:complete len:412 (-),score=133.14 TRINITY_DN559_c0_g1_i14:22-1257(-)
MFGTGGFGTGTTTGGFGTPSAGRGTGGFGTGTTGGFGTGTTGAFGTPTAGRGTTGGFGTATGAFGTPTAGRGTTGGFGTGTTGGFGTTGAFGTPAAGRGTGGFGTGATGGFGAGTTIGGFGTGATGGFGTPSGRGTGGFGTGTTGGFGRGSVGTTGFGAASVGVGGSMNVPQYGLNPNDAVHRIGRHLLNSFKHIFYNRFDPNNPRGKPADMPDDQWEFAMKRNPDPNNLIPYLASGFKELKSRYLKQQDMKSKQEALLEEIKMFIADMEQRRIKDTIAKNESFQVNQMAISHKLLAIMIKVEVLHSRGSSDTKEFYDWYGELKQLDKELRNLWIKFRSQLPQIILFIKLQEEKPPDQYKVKGDLEDLQKYIEDMNVGLTFLTKQLKEDLECLECIRKKLDEPIKRWMELK